MISSLQQTLSRLKKYNYFSEAILYNSLRVTLYTTLPESYPQFLDEFSQTQIFYKLKPDSLWLKLTSDNLSFISFLKTESTQIHNIFLTDLLNKKQLTSEQTITLVCLGK